MKELERILKALANRRRLIILKILEKQSNVPVGDIADRISLSFRSTSRHLAVLRSAEIVEFKQVNLAMLYSLKQPASPIVKCVLETANSHE